LHIASSLEGELGSDAGGLPLDIWETEPNKANKPAPHQVDPKLAEPVCYRWFINTETTGLATTSDSCTAGDIRVSTQVSSGPAAVCSYLRRVGPTHNCVWLTEYWSKAHVMSPGEPVTFSKEVLVGAIPTLPSRWGGWGRLP
jgi:hypothetical protein